MEVSRELFNRIDRTGMDTNEIVRPSMTYWQDAWRRLKKDRLAVAGLILVAFITLLAIIGPVISKYNYYSQDLNMANMGPSLNHIMGTDNLGRDIYIRILYGARISLAVGFVASVINLTIGILYGGIAGFFGGFIDNIMMRFIDVLYSVPTTLYVILLMVVIGPGLKSIFLTLGIAYWLSMARIVRAQVMALKEQEFVLAARTLGAPKWRILMRHLIPNSMGPIIVTLTLSIPSAIFTEAFLSFIGLGVSAPMASWGVLCSDALDQFLAYPYQLFFPALAISLTMLGFNFLGDGLRDALDPKMRK